MNALGSDDNIGVAERLATPLVNGRSTSIPGTGHHPKTENPEKLTRIVAEFVRTLKAR